MPNEKKKSDYEVITEKDAMAVVKPEKLRAVRRLTMDATSLARHGDLICQALGELERIDMGKPDKNGEVPQAWALPILDVVERKEYLLICNVMMVGALRRSGEPLVKKYFAMRPGEIVAGKRFRKCDVIELELAE